MKFNILSFIFTIIFNQFGIISFGNSLPLNKLSSDTSSNKVEEPPLYFPSNGDGYVIKPPNRTALEILQHQALVKNMITDKSPIYDLHNIRDMVSDLNESDPKMDVEEVQNINNDVTVGNVELEEQFRPNSIKTDSMNNIFEFLNADNPKYETNRWNAVIIATTLTIICLLAWILLALWRHHLQRKYGNRIRLIDEDDDIQIIKITEK